MRHLHHSALPWWPLLGLALSSWTHAQTSAPADPPTVPSLPAVTAKASGFDASTTEADRPNVTIGTTDIQRRQANKLFDIAGDTPGVSVSGGPRDSGMKFNIRGFSDNDDVVFKIDGAVKGFEKYRFGSGVFIEPELLKTVTVHKGPSVTSTSGALGGTIEATTRSASDLLRPGQRLGALVKAGFASNNTERLRMVALYGQPSDEWEWLGAYTERNATDIRLAGGERLTASASANSSHLLKLGWFPHPAFWGELSLVGYRSGPQRAPYDANTDEPGSFGLVRRTVDDQTLTLRTQLAPADSWLNLRTVIAHENTRLTDLALQSDNGVTYDPAVSSLRGPGDKTDHWRYDIWSAEVFNDAAWQAGEFKGVLTLGWQGLRNARTLERLTQNPTWNSPTGAYPNGFYPAQPPGTKTSQGWVAEHALTWQGFTLTPGARWDRYTLEATGGARTALQAAMQSPKLSFSQVSSSLRLSWQPDLWQRQWVFTLSQADAFRPPLIDEAFTSGAYSRCLPSSGSVHFPLYDASLGQDKAPASGACGDLYRPQVSTTRELAVAWQPRATLLGARWQAKVATFRVKTRDTLNSLSAHDGVIDQPGREHRRGLEVDVRADAPRWFGTLGHAKVAGQVSAAGLSLTQSYNGPLYDVPGATTTLSLGLKNPASTWEAGLRLRDIQDRSSLVYQTATACSTAGTTRVNGLGYLGTQYGVQLTDLFATYRLSLQQPQDTALRLSVDNLTDELYCLNDGLGGGVGTQAAGRNIKVQVSWQW